MAHALLLDDDRPTLEALTEVVSREGLETEAVRTVAEAVKALRDNPPDLIITDLMLPDGRGLDLMQYIEPPYDPEVILITGHATVETAVEALRLGVSDYLTKPVDLVRLQTVLANVARTRDLKSQIGVLRDELRQLGRFGPLVGVSKEMSEVYDLISKVAATDATVLITGESGTGKDLVAQTIHQLSRRHKGPFLPLNCGAVSPTLIESELFGHERGSFTGAESLHRGHFERASGGTLFLDEVTEMPPELQAKLLRVLESGSINRIGGEESIRVDVRVVAATNRSPEQATQDGHLREDLLYRLNVFPIDLPPLRCRGGDVELLVQHFLDQLNRRTQRNTRLSEEAMGRLAAHSWPGNVRELANLVHRAHILAESEIRAEHLPDDLGTESPSPTGGAGRNRQSLEIPVGVSIAEAEKQLIFATLDLYEGNKQRAADALGVSLKTLYNRLNSYDRQ
jgi:two-component system, NtrC family, response regulator AtoC